MADFTDIIDDLEISITAFSNSKLKTKAAVASGLKYKVTTLAPTSGTVTCDFEAAQVFLIEPTGNITFEFSNLPSTNEYIVSIIRIKKGGLYTVTWPVGSKYPEDTPPLLSATGEDIITVQYDNASSTYWITNVKSDWTE